MVTEGFRVRPVRSTRRSRPRGASSARTSSATAATRPYRVHLREPSFINLQATAALSVGGMVSDVIASVGSIDPVMGGCDR